LVDIDAAGQRELYELERVSEKLIEQGKDERANMSCAANGEQMLIFKYLGIEVDYCPVNKLVWLDGGEFEKIKEKYAKKHYGEYKQPLEMRYFHWIDPALSFLSVVAASYFKGISRS